MNLAREIEHREEKVMKKANKIHHDMRRLKKKRKKKRRIKKKKVISKEAFKSDDENYEVKI
jgi:hypothetical protein